MKGEERQTDEEGEEEKLENEIGTEMDSEDGKTGDVEEADGATETREHGAEAMGPLAQRAFGLGHVVGGCTVT